MKKIAITTGDPAGIGPEITSKAIRYIHLFPGIVFIVYGQIDEFNDGNKIERINDIDKAELSDRIYWIEIGNEDIVKGIPTKTSGEITFAILSRCADDLKSGKLDAVVTAPVSKDAIRHSQPDFIGHTEFFAARSNSKNVVMSFWGPHFNLALLSTHIAVSEISNYLKNNALKPKFRLIYKEINNRINNPKIAMLAVNPHAGEKGAFGKDDELIEDVLKDLKSENIQIDGPFPADTFFATKATDYNMIISAFHDQGLIPFKMISADEGVNVTLGLPYIRSSVDHGTAYDIAGKGVASEKSLLQAIEFAVKSLLNKKQQKNNYTVFAEYYDNYMSHVNYEKWVDFILTHYNKKFSKSPRSILELACGSANVSSLLVKKGLRVDASDLSAEMLKIAAGKPFAPNLYHHDMMDILPTENYDLILLLFDSMNYLNDLKQVNKVLNNVNKSLISNGLFIFDITTLKNCEHHFDGFLNIEDDETKTFIHTSNFEVSSGIQTTDLTFFKKKGFMYERFDEKHEQKIFNVDELIQCVQNSPLDLIGIYNIGTKENLVDHNAKILEANFSRLFFILQKQ